MCDHILEPTSTAMVLATCGPMKPGNVFAIFVIPMSTPANLGAMSSWLVLAPTIINDANITARLRKSTAVAGVVPR